MTQVERRDDFGVFPGGAWASWRARRRRARFFRALAAMEDWQLDDLGLSRRAVERAARIGRLFANAKGRPGGRP